MLFDINPKENKVDLFDREKELKEILEALELGERLVVIYGVWRVGKTSLLKVALKEANIPYAIIDVKGMYHEHGGVPKAGLYKELASSFNKNLNTLNRLGFQLKEVLKRVRGFHITEVGVEVEPVPKATLLDLLSEINRWCEENGTRFALAFDEAQYLRFGGKIKYDGIMAWSIDNLPRITILIAGSEVGVLRDFLQFDNPRAPLYGRYRREIVVDRFTEREGIDFLSKGFEELGMKVKKDELKRIFETLDGVVGWLTLYGYYRSMRGMSADQALSAVLEEGSKMVLEELEKIISPSPKRYLAILKATSQGIKKWSEIKRFVIVKSGYITDARFTALLNSLIKYGYLAKEDNEYKILDPVVRQALESV